jgi:predicted PurR-regulated permease PerM
MSASLRMQFLTLLIVIGVLLYILGPVLTPFAMAALLAYLGDPLADQLERRGLSRQNAVLVVFVTMSLLLTAVLLILVPMLERQISKLITQLPKYVEWLKVTALPWIVAKLGLDSELAEPGQLGDQVANLLKQHWQSAGGLAATVMASVSQSGLAVLGWIANLVLIPMLTFYFLRDWDRLINHIDDLLPRHVDALVRRLARESDEVLGAFMRGQLSVMAALATIYSVGLWMIGLDLALLIGLAAGLISFVPYLGTILGMGAALIAAVVQFGPQDWFHPGMVLVVFVIGQMLEGFVLTPLLVGDRIGLHPVAVIFAIMAGGQLFGFLGVLLALPVAAVLMVGLRYLHERYKRSDLYGGTAPETPEPTVTPTSSEVVVSVTPLADDPQSR